MTANTTLDHDIAALAEQCGVDAITVQLAAEGVARRLAALFGGAEQAAEQMDAAAVAAAMNHYTASMRACTERALADPGQIIALLYARA